MRMQLDRDHHNCILLNENAVFVSDELYVNACYTSWQTAMAISLSSSKLTSIVNNTVMDPVAQWMPFNERVDAD